MGRFKTPCQTALWYVLPAIRRELARILIEEHKMSQRKAADILGLSEAAVSQYVHKKRGRTPITFDKKAIDVMKRIATDMAKSKSNAPLNKKICTLCRMIFPKFSKVYEI
ncbi:MAG: transcriptional regulator [Candidatus Odinarchaeia archaeon]